MSGRERYIQNAIARRDQAKVSGGAVRKFLLCSMRFWAQMAVNQNKTTKGQNEAITNQTHG